MLAPRLHRASIRLVAILLLAACHDRSASGGAPSASASAAIPIGVPIGFDLSPQERARAQALADHVSDYQHRFPPEETSNPRNARVFLWLAARDARRPVLCAALEALRSGGEDRQLPSQDLCEVVAHHLGSTDPMVAAHALRGSVALESVPCPAAIDRAIGLARRADPGMRRLAIDELCTIGGARDRAEVVDAYVRAVADPVPAVAAMALFRIAAHSHWEHVDRLVAAARQQLGHADPGVRGLALDVVSQLARGQPWVLAELLRRLDDPHPYVRSSAADGLGRCGDPSVIHALMRHVDDREGSHHSLPIALPTGESDSLAYPAGPYNQVRDSVLRAIASASRKLDRPFEQVEGELARARQKPRGPAVWSGTRPTTAQMNATLDERAARAKRWYAADRARVRPLQIEPSR